MVLDINADQDEVLAFCGDLKEKLDAQIDASKRIAKFQKLFKVMESQYEELEATVTDVETKANLWQGRKEWQDLQEAWGNLMFEEVDVPTMEETVQVRTHKRRAA
jgi:tRNA splicing ligase